MLRCLDVPKKTTVFNKSFEKLGRSRKCELGQALKAAVYAFATLSLPRYSKSEITDVVKAFFMEDDQEAEVLSQFKLAYNNAKAEDNKTLLHSLGSILVSAGMSRDECQKIYRR